MPQEKEIVGVHPHDFIGRRQSARGDIAAEAFRSDAVPEYAHRAERLIFDGGVTDRARQHVGGGKIVDPERLNHAGVGHECAGALAIGRLELVDVLEDRPELHSEPRHQPHPAFHRIKTAERGELIKQEQDPAFRPGRGARHVGDGLGDQQSQSADIGVEPIGRQAQEHRARPLLQVGEPEIGRGRAVHDARAVEKVGVALGGRQHTGGLAIGLAEVAVGGARDQAVRAGAGLHVGEPRGEAGGIAGERSPAWRGTLVRGRRCAG